MHNSHTQEEKNHFYLHSLSLWFFEHISIMPVFISLAQSVMKIRLITLICATRSFYKHQFWCWKTGKQHPETFWHWWILTDLHQMRILPKKVTFVFSLQLWNLATSSPYCQLCHLLETPHQLIKHGSFPSLHCAQTIPAQNRWVYSNQLVNLHVFL